MLPDRGLGLLTLGQKRFYFRSGSPLVLRLNVGGCSRSIPSPEALTQIAIVEHKVAGREVD
jgi:hypothetical protein